MDKNIGKKFGYLKILEVTTVRKGNRNRLYYKCQCDCGNITIKDKYSIVRGATLSCGCLTKELQTKHGYASHDLYSIWSGIKDRCDNKKCKGYENYGGRGISYDPTWKDDVGKFIKDIENYLGKRPSNKHSLDRIDNNKGYYIDNLRWADYSVQARNKRNKTTTKHYCISEIHDGNFLVTILKEGYKRQSATMYNLNEAIQLRDLWEKQWRENKEQWIKDTIDSSYDKHLQGHRYKNSTGYKCISKRRNRQYWVRIYKQKICRSGKAKTLDKAIELRDKWLEEYKNNPEQWIEETINKTYSKD